MTSKLIVKYLNPWKHKRERAAERLAELRKRDGDKCARCRRKMRFDLPPDHDQGPRIEPILPTGDSLDNLCLTHVRCNARGRDNTEEVMERLRPAREAELFAKSRRRRKKAA